MTSWSSILEYATVATANSQIEMIKKLAGWSDGDFAQQVARSKRSLDLLTAGGTPNYDDAVVSLLYLLRYHYSHVNLAWSTIAASQSQHSTGHSYERGADLQIVDFGAGTSAMYLGTVLYVAEAIAAGRWDRPVIVQSIEPSLAMQAMAVAFTREFRKTVENADRGSGGQLSPVVEAFNLVEHSFHRDRSEIQRASRFRLLSALHTVYEEPVHSRALKSSLGKLNWRLAPTEGLMTFNLSKRQGALDIAPFNGKERSLELRHKLPDRKLQELDQVCRSIGFVRYPDNPRARQVFSITKDAAALHWPDLLPANILGTQQ